MVRGRASRLPNAEARVASSYYGILTMGGETVTSAPFLWLIARRRCRRGVFMRLRSTVTIIDLELRVLVAYRAADGVYGEVPPMSVFDELLDQRLRLMASGRASMNDGAAQRLRVGNTAAETTAPRQGVTPGA